MSENGLYQTGFDLTKIGSQYNINTLEEQPRVFIGDEPIKGVQVTKALCVKTDHAIFKLGLLY
jgi:hypothetical protein